MTEASISAALTRAAYEPPLIFLYAGDADLADTVALFLQRAIARSAAQPVAIDRRDAAAFLRGEAAVARFFDGAQLFAQAEALFLAGANDAQCKALAAEAPHAATDGKWLLFSSGALKRRAETLKAVRAHPNCLFVNCYKSDWTPRSLAAHLGGPHAPDPRVLAGLTDLAALTAPAHFLMALEKTRHFLAIEAPVEDVLALLEDEIATLDLDLPIALLSDTLTACLAHVGRVATTPAAAISTLSQLAASIGALNAAMQDAGQRKRLFWKLAEALNAAQRRTPALPSRIETALREVYAAEGKARSAATASPPRLLERLVIRLHAVLNRR
ncbi:MAG: hypothetical protein AAFR16_02275 [Pseudomonadota bacterium]